MKALQVINTFLLLGIFILAWSILSRLDHQFVVYEENIPLKVQIER